MFKKLNNYHPKIKLAIEINPPKFLDTEIIILNNEVITSVQNLNFPSITNVTLYLFNFTLLKRHPRIFKKKLKILKKNFPLRFINSVVVQFNNNIYENNETNEEDEMIIPPQLFEISKKILFLQVPSCEAN